MLSNLFDCLSLIVDPRLDRRKLHPLDFILLIVFTSTLFGCNSWYDIEDYAEHWEEDLKHLYKALTGKDILHGIPRHDSLNRAISLLDPEVFEDAYTVWLESFIHLTSGSHICIDGKSMRGVRKPSFDAQSHTVSANSPKRALRNCLCFLGRIFAVFFLLI